MAEKIKTKIVASVTRSSYCMHSIGHTIEQSEQIKKMEGTLYHKWFLGSFYCKYRKEHLAIYPREDPCLGCKHRKIPFKESDKNYKIYKSS